jgi:hypothetical protein
MEHQPPATSTKPPAIVHRPMEASIDASLYIRRRGIAVLVLVLFSCIGAGALLMAIRPPEIHSHEDQVRYALGERSMRVVSFELGERWPDPINFQYGPNVFPYGYRVSIRLGDGTLQSGWLGCDQLDRSCSLSISELDIQGLPLPDITKDDELPILARLRALLAEVHL